MKILFVCLGNICRSPMAEGVMKYKVEALGLDWTIDSAGTESFHIGEAPHKFSQQVCLEHGIDISHQRANRFSKVDFDKYDKIYAMAKDVLEEIKDMSGHQFDPTIAELFLNELYPNQGMSVKDPYYGGKEGYDEVYEQINSCCDRMLAKYKNIL